VIKVVFMGTPEFAVPALRALHDAFNVVGVVTQPDRPCGRGRRVAPSSVKRVALERSLPLYQPCSLTTGEALTQLAAWSPDVIVVAAFGHILRQDVLGLPRYGCLNVHASLLPRWRGAAPAAAAILHGDDVTGVTIMRMDAGLDTGPVLGQREERVREDDTRLSLEMRLAELGAELLVEVLPPYCDGSLSPVSQCDEVATLAPCLTKRDGLLDWYRAAVELGRRVRAFSPWPGTFTWWRQRRLKILQAAPLPSWRGEAPPGTVIPWEAAPGGDTGAAVVTGEGALRLATIQLAGKRPMDIGAFLQGQRDFVGSRLARECG
jgi:methionyl-tRNA formyltransferase